MDKALLAAAQAIQENIGKQFNAKPAPGREWDPNSWTATGGVINCEELAEACIGAWLSASQEYVQRLLKERKDG